MSRWVLFPFLWSALVFGRNCSYDVTVTGLSEFNKSLTVNAFGYPQGSNISNPISSYTLHPSGDGSASFVFSNQNEKWFSSLCSTQNSCLNVSLFDAIKIVIKDYDQLGLDPTTDIFSIRLVGSNFVRLVLSRQMEVDAATADGSIFILLFGSLQGATSLELGAEIGLFGKQFSIREISFVNIETKCMQRPPPKKGLVWAKDQILMLDDKPFKFLGFYVPTILNSSKIEQEDLIKTAARLGGPGTKVIQTAPVLKVKGDPGCSDEDSFILAKGKWNEKILLNMDQLLVLARQYDVKVVIPFVHWSASISTFAQIHGSQAHEFFTDPNLLPFLFEFMDMVLNRTNSLNGLRYSNDETIMGWAYGLRLVLTDIFSVPPRSWFRSVALHIMSHDSNHLIFDGRAYYDNILFLMDSYTDVLGIPILWGDPDLYEFAKLALLSKILRQPFHLSLVASMQPLELRVFLDSIYYEVIYNNQFNTSSFSGSFLRFLAGRKAAIGWDLYHEMETNQQKYPGMHYPGFSFDDNAQRESLRGSSAEKFRICEEISHNLRLVSLNNGATVTDTEIYHLPALDPPAILSATYAQSTIEIVFFGSVGATSYTIYKSMDNKTFTVFGSEFILETTGTTISETSSEYSKFRCSSSVFFKIIANRGDDMKSSPRYFVVQIVVPKEPPECRILKSTLTSSSLSLEAESSGMGYSTFLAIVVPTIFLLISVSAFWLFRYLKRSKERKEGIINKGKEISQHEMSKTFSLHGAHKELSVPGYMKLDFKKDLHSDDNNVQTERGKGFTSKVVKGTLKSAALIQKYGSKMQVAIKLMNSEDDDYLHEVAIMSCLPPSPYIVHLIGYSENPKAIVMKYYPISLKLLLRSPEIGSNPMLRLKIGFDIANGMNIIHSHSILHLDLKPHNVLVDIYGDGSFVCAICDFGFSNVIGDDRKIGSVSGLLSPQTAGLTARYASPEGSIEFRVSDDALINFQLELSDLGRFNREEDKKIDVYAFAITFYEILFGIDAWKDMGLDSIRTAVTKGIRPEMTSDLKSIYQRHFTLVDLIGKCWDQNPLARPDFHTICTVFESDYNTPDTDAVSSLV